MPLLIETGERSFVSGNVSFDMMAKRGLRAVAQEIAGHPAEIGLGPVQPQAARRSQASQTAEDVVDEIQRLIPAGRPALQGTEQSGGFRSVERVQANRRVRGR